MENWKLVKIGTTGSQRKLFFNLTRERDRLVTEGFSPRPDILAKRLNVKEEEVVEMSQRLEGWELSLSAPVGDDSKESYGAFLPDPTGDIDKLLSDEQLRQNLTQKLREFRGRLTDREADIFDNRIMAEEPLILQELGEKYSISRERVRQIQKEITSNIKKWSKKEIPNFEKEYSELLN
jgi:RNA polymerase sigma-32 factor